MPLTHPRIEPFTMAVPDAVLADLRQRLAATRWPFEPQPQPWRYGTELAVPESTGSST